MWRVHPQYIVSSIWGQIARRRSERMDKDNERVEKTWGSELWFANNDMYCGKLLTVNVDKWSSEGKFHYHKIKDEKDINCA